MIVQHHRVMQVVSSRSSEPPHTPKLLFPQQPPIRVEVRLLGRAGACCRLRGWRPARFEKAIILFVTDDGHGYQEIAHLIATQGYSVYAAGVRAHCRPRRKGRRWQVDTLADDQGALLHLLHADAPRAPIFVVGHGMVASMVVLRLLERCGRRPAIVGGAISVRLPWIALMLLRLIAAVLANRSVRALCEIVKTPREEIKALTRPDSVLSTGNANGWAALIEWIERQLQARGHLV